MTESIHKYAKIGLVHFMAYPSTIKGDGPIEETILKIAVDDYFDALEITWIKDALVIHHMHWGPRFVIAVILSFRNIIIGYSHFRTSKTTVEENKSVSLSM